jgi:hypothetical protein
MAMALSSLQSRVGAALLLIAIATTPVQAEIRLRLSQPVYEVGEPVSFRLSNESKWVITLPHAIGWWNISDAHNLVGGARCSRPRWSCIQGIRSRIVGISTIAMKGRRCHRVFTI